MPPPVPGLTLAVLAVCPGDVLTRMCVDAEARAHAVSAEVAAGDERAVAFLDRLLGMGDYAHFAQSMRAGGNRLKVSGLDLEQLTGGRHADMALYV